MHQLANKTTQEANADSGKNIVFQKERDSH